MGLKENIQEIEGKVEQVSFAYELLSDYKKQNKRQFVVILVILGMWFITGAYLVWTLNDIGVIEETTTTTQEIEDVDTIGGNVVNNGDVYGES
jgi:hypothetical protein